MRVKKPLNKKRIPFFFQFRVRLKMLVVQVNDIAI